MKKFSNNKKNDETEKKSAVESDAAINKNDPVNGNEVIDKNEKSNKNNTADKSERTDTAEFDTIQEENRSRINKENFKSENKKNLKSSRRMSVNITAFISVIIMAFGILFCYPKLKVIANNEKRTPYEDYNLLRNIDSSSFLLYKDIVEKQSGEKKTLEDIYIESYSDNYNTDDVRENDSIEKVVENVQSRVYSLQSKLDYDLKNLEYAALDKDGNLIINRGLDDISTVLSQEDNGIEKLKDKYGFYIVINYDSKGYPEIKGYYGAGFDYIRNTFGQNNINSQSASEYNGIKVNYNKIKDTTIVYGIPKDLKYDDSISKAVAENSEDYVSVDIIMMFGLITGLIILFIGLIIPYRIEKKIAGFKKLLKMPFEAACVFYWIFSAVLIGSAIGISSRTLNNKAERIFEYLKISSTFDSTIIYFVNLVMWMIIIYFIISGMTYIKSIFDYGFKNYLKEKVLVIRFFRFIFRKAEDGFENLSHVDLSDRSNKVIIKVLVINFIILSAISIIWFFGIFAAVIYNIILFVLIRKYYDKVRNNYRSLLNATNKIADGKLDFEIKEDLGIFNPFKAELKKIQSGFKKAVDEEVKSQKMKTDLISNVSHDLKTPLTSIITYVDLLKNENITENERKSYIDTIDRKSQRLKFLIEDLFEVSKATSGNIKLNPVDVDIIELIKQVEIELADKFENAGLTIKNNFPEGKMILHVDSQKTFRIFENILNNAAKYSMKGSRVYVDVVKEDEFTVITVKNMSAVEIDYKADEIVERFQRGDKSRNTEGSGLGLAIAKSFVEAQKGTFKIQLDGDLFKVMISLK